MRIETLTLNQTVRKMRELGIPTSPQKLGNGLEQGKYPFGVCIMSDKGRRIFEIYKADFERWAQNRIEGKYEERQVPETIINKHANVSKDATDTPKNDARKNTDIKITIPINCVLSIEIPGKEFMGANEEKRKLQAIVQGTVKRFNR